VPAGDGSPQVFAPWPAAQRAVDVLAREPRPASWRLRGTAVLTPLLAARIAAWFTGAPASPAGDVRRCYAALERETARLFAVVTGAGLGVQVRYVRGGAEPYPDGAALCAELRAHASMTLRTIAVEAPHPLLASHEAGVVDELRAVHDVFGHAALGVGFDLQSEFATWLQCRTLFSPDAQRAAFCELVGAVTTYVMTGEKPLLRADLPPPALLSACAPA
jgi:hypothetical protein